MEKFFKKHESFISIGLIVIYVIYNSYCINNFGKQDIRTALASTLFSIILIALIISIKRVKFYGLTKVKEPKKYLYFIPLLIIISTNFWCGIHLNHTTKEIVCHILLMLNVGFIEEIIFRGFLFKEMSKDNLKAAIIVSSLTFGIGHIVNLLNGANLIPTLMQISYAVALGYLFVTIFYKSNSLIPCIITHQAINSLSIFNGGYYDDANSIMLYVVTITLIVVSVGYAAYINKNINDKKA